MPRANVCVYYVHYVAAVGPI